MPKHDETVAEVLAALRKCSDEWIGDGSFVSMKGAGCFASHLADRIEAAWKRERDECRMLAATTIVTEKVPVGNAAATYEALEKVRFYLPYMVQYVRLNWEDVDTGGYYDKILGIIEAALSAPPRQCDVGTAEEMRSRYGRYCQSHLCGKCEFDRETDDIDDEKSCIVRWMVSPYAEEGAAK